MRFAPAFLPLLLVTRPVVSQEGTQVQFAGVSCTPEQVAAGDAHGKDLPYALWSELRLPGLIEPRPEPEFRATRGTVGPLWAYLSFVVNTSGQIDLCTVRLLRQNDSKWTRAVLEVLPRYRYRPAELAGVPRCVLIREDVYFRPQP